MGGGSLWDVGCYPLSYSNFLAGAAPVEVVGWQRTSPRGIDLEFFAMMRYASGAVAQFDSGFAGPFRTDMEVVGTDGALRIHRPFKTDARSGLALTRGDAVEALPCATEAAYAGEIADMERAALDGRAPRVSLAESRRTVQTIVALHQSAQSGRSVTL
jgi:predicted dehydrogenase